MNIDIQKAGGILIRDRRFLVERSKGKEFFIAPGGKIEEGESPQQALVRELKEEFSIIVQESDLKEFGIFEANAAGQEHRKLKMYVFILEKWDGEPTASSEVEEIAWINSTITQNMKVGSIFEHEVMPRLKKGGLIE